MLPSPRRRPAVTLVLLALAFLLAIGLSSTFLRGAQIDLTQAREHTLSPATITLLRGVPEPVTLRLYFSRRAAADFPQVRAYAQRVEELLVAMAARSDGRLIVELIDPEPFSEEEDRATGFGLTAVPLPGGGNFFFGLVGSNRIDGELPIPFLDAAREPFLEYDVAKLVAALGSPRRPVVAFYAGLPMAPHFDLEAGQPSPGWAVDQQLRGLFDLRRLEAGFTAIPADADLLLLVHPRGLTDDTLYAIDQFALRGGRLLVFVDPDAENQPPEDPLAGGLEPRDSNLAPLLAAWGVDYDPDRVVGDPVHALPVQARESGPTEPLVTLLGLGADALARDDIVTAALERVNLSSAGALRPRSGADTRFDPLLHTSAGSGELPVGLMGTAGATPANLLRALRPEGGARVLAARISGPVATAFPQRTGEGHLARSQRDLEAIVVADTDLLGDAMWVNPAALPGLAAEPFANNGDLVFNAVENLSGQPGLIALRARAVARRPFAAVEALRRDAEQRFLGAAQALQQQLSDLETRLAALTRGEPGAPAVPGPAQQAEIRRFQQQKAELRRQLREVQHQLNRDIERLAAGVKLLNIVIVPLLVACAFALYGLWRVRRRRHA